MKWSYRKCCCVEQKKHSQLPLTVSRTEAVPFTFMTHGVVFSDQQHSSHGQTFNRCWCRLLEHRRAAWWAEIRLFAASLACIWCHCARKFNEILWWKAADKLLPIYFHLFMDLKSPSKVKFRLLSSGCLTKLQSVSYWQDFDFGRYLLHLVIWFCPLSRTLESC